MKTYKEFITERNKFEKYLLQKGIKNISKIVRKNPKSFDMVKDDIANQIKNLRFDPDYRFSSLRRGAENVANRFRDMLAPSGINPNEVSNVTKLRQITTRGANKKSWLGSQTNQLTKPPIGGGDVLDDVVATQFPKNVRRKPTTDNVDYRLVPNQFKNFDDKSVIKRFRRKK